MQCGLASAQQPSIWPCEGSWRFLVGTNRGRASCVLVHARRARLEEKCGLQRSSLSFLGSGLLGIRVLSGHGGNEWKDSCSGKSYSAGGGVYASLMVDPVWIIRTAVFYVLIETGIAVRGRPLQSSDSRDGQSEAKGPLAWIQNRLGADAEQKRNKELAKVRSKWQASIKGTLVRRYRVPSKAEGRKLLSAISSLLADDDTFRDVATHKGCQIRRENAHAESVCCHNVRALFDELPTPHLIVEITVFPAGPITAAHYEKADKIEKVLRTGVSI